MVSQIVSTFSPRPVFGYLGMIYAMIAIGVIGFVVWAHHMFVAGISVKLKNLFHITQTMVIAVPTGIKIFSWIATMWALLLPSHARCCGLLDLSFCTIGGVAGVVLANAGVDVP